MTSPIENFLAGHPNGVTALDFARDYMGLAGPPDRLEDVAAAILRRTPGATPGSDGRWRWGADPTAEVALEVRATGAYPPLDALLAVGACRPGDRASGILDLLVRPAASVPDEAIRAAGVDPDAARRGLPLADAMEEAARFLGGARILTFRSDHPWRIVRRALRAEGREVTTRGSLAIRPALRSLDFVPPRGGLTDAASALGIPVPDAPTVGELAAVLAEVARAARSRGHDLTPPPPPPGFDFSGTDFGPDLLSELPEAPGVYRFLDETGNILYIGKAANLRRRVRDYFRPGTDRRRLHERMMEEVHDLAWRETGSELLALLREMHEIREHAPPYNVQREIRRSRPVDGDLVLFLPRVDEREVTLLFVRAGRPAGRATADRRGRGMREVRSALTRIYRDGEPADSTPEEGEILASWLRARRDRHNHLDLSQAAGLADAARRIKAYLTDPDLFSGRVYRR